jgi:C1A family cysteine protease
LSKGRLEEEDVPESVDWVKMGKVQTPADQRSCGSCWAFTTASTLESLFAIKNNIAPPKYSV